MIPGIVAGKSGSALVPDPYWASVRLLIHGPAGAVDASPHGEVLTNLTSVTVTDGALQYLGPTGDRVLTTTSDGTFCMTGGQTYTLEFTLKAIQDNAGYFFTPPSAFPYMQWVGAGANKIQINGNYTGSSIIEAPHVFGATHHYAFIIETGPHRTRLYKDGVLVSSVTATPSNYDPTMKMGLFGVPGISGLQSFRGQISNVRFTRGIARYNSDYTVVVPFPVFGP